MAEDPSVKELGARLEHIKPAANTQARGQGGRRGGGGGWGGAWSWLHAIRMRAESNTLELAPTRTPSPTTLPYSPPPPPTHPYSWQVAAIKGLLGELRLGLRHINTEVVQAARTRDLEGSGSAHFRRVAWQCVGVLARGWMWGTERRGRASRVPL